METLKLGNVGQEVKELQTLLLSHGFKVEIDGQFGPQTQTAVKNFQKLHNLPSDGIVGDLTWKKLEGPKNEEPPKVVIPEDTKELDERSLKYLNTLDPKAKKIFIPFLLEAKKIAAQLGYDYLVISGNRTWEEQNELYAQGRTKPGNKVTNAKGGSSNHNYKIAIDCGCFKNGKYIDEKSPTESTKIHTAVSKLCPKYGLDWGGGWTTIKDYPHFEIKTGLTLAEKRELFLKNGSVL